MNVERATLIERFHQRYRTSDWIKEDPSILSIYLDSSDHIRQRFLAACLLARSEAIVQMASDSAIDCPFVLYSALEACCQRGVFNASRIIVLFLLCVTTDQSLVLLECLCRRGCLAATRWWMEQVQLDLERNGRHLLHVVSSNGRWTIWKLLYHHCPRLQYDRQLYCFARACTNGQLFFAQQLFQSYPLIAECTQKKQIYMDSWNVGRDVPHYRKVIETARWLSEIITDFVSLGPIILSPTSIQKPWKRVTTKTTKQIIESTGLMKKSLKAYIHPEYSEMDPKDLKKLVSRFVR